MMSGRLHERRANVGGPMSRSRSQPIRASLLQGDRATFDCCRQLGVDFGEHDPIEAVHAALREARVPDPESLRARFALPAEPCLCREVPALAVPRLQDLAAEDLLERALLLGLSTPWLLDPRRPLLLTRTALRRRLEVYTARGFYA